MVAMSLPFAFAALVTVLLLAACVVTFPEQRAWPIPRWRLTLSPLLAAAATIVVLYLPPSNDLKEPAVWMVGLVAGVLGVVRGAMIGLQVDQRSGRLLLLRAPEGFWIAVVAAVVILGEHVVGPLGRVGDSGHSVELVLVILSSFLAGRNAALLVRSNDTPHGDL
jgi:hypothetical protein